MANQPPPARPWTRFGSMRIPQPQPATAATAPAPETQPQPQPQPQPQAQTQLQPAPAPAPAPAPPAARPIVRTAFGQRPTTQMQQPPPPSATVAPPPPSATMAPPPFRLGSISVPSSPVKTTASVPTSPVALKTGGGTSSVPPSPVQKMVTTLSSVPTSPVKSPKASAPSLAVPTSPTTKIISTTTTTTTSYTTETVPEPPPAALVPQFFRLPARTTPPADKAKPAAPPPSPLILPPAQPKSAPEPIEQKAVVVEKPKSPFKPSLAGPQREAGDTVKTGFFSDIKDQKGSLKKLTDSDDATTKIITLAGDNTGAVMELSPAGKKLDPAEGRKTAPRSWWGQKLGSDSSSSDEEKSKNRDKAPNKLGTPSPPMNAFMNSNVQAVNNSILFNTSCHHHDPGVHVIFTRRGGGGRALHLKDGGDGQDK